MAWRELVLTDANAELLVFTTADLRWQPLVSDDPNGAQIATLWGDPADKEFGELVFRQGLTSAGVLLLRLHGLSISNKARIVLEALTQHQAEMLGAFSVVSPGHIRIRPRLSAGA